MNAMSVMTQQAGETVRLDAWRSVFEKTNRIISQRPVTVQVVMDIPYGMDEIPGWSDGEVIHFNGPLVLDMLRAHDAVAAVLRLKGLNYHELSHVLFTPRMSDELPKRVVERATQDGDKRWWYAFNALEDQRIETWFTASYSPSKRYFEAAVLQWLVTKGNAEAAILTHGRKYLPARIRVQAGRVFVAKYGQPLYDEFKAVIDQYLTVILPADSVRALTLVGQYRDLLRKMQAAGGSGCPPLPVEDNGCHKGNHGGTPNRGDTSVIRVGRVLQREAKAARDAAKVTAKAAAEADAQAEADIKAEAKPPSHPPTGDIPAGGQPEPEAGEGEGDPGGCTMSFPAEGDGETEGEGEGPGTGGEPVDGDGEAEGGQGTEGGDGNGAVTTTVTAPGAPSTGAGGEAGEHHVLELDELQQAIADMISEAESGIDDIMADPDVRDDAGRVLDAVKAVANNGNINAEGALAKNRGTVPATAEEKASVRRITTILTKIRQEAEPEILRGKPSGRVDVRRLLSRRPNDFDIFTTFDEGSEDDTGIEAVVLLDVSGSMGYMMREASSAVWVLKRAFDKLDIRTTCMVYDTEHYILYQPGDKAQAEVPVISTMGGTDPTSALQQARIILGKSNKPNKVLITVTDGSWQGDDDEYKDVMKALKQVGATSLLLGLHGAEKYYGKHFHDVGHDMATVKDLPKAALKLVGAILRTATNND